MSNLQVYDLKGAEAGTFEVPAEWLVGEKGGQAVHDAVTAYLAGRRAGTASTLTKSEVAGSGKKPWRQKGTGRARAGYRQSPVWRGGSVAFGPHPRSFRLKLNKKVARLAMRRVFSERVAAGKVILIEELTVPEARTRLFREILKALKIEGGALFVTDKVDEKVALASRNLPGIAVVAARNVNAYLLMRYPAIVMTRQGMAEMAARLGRSVEEIR